MAWLSQGLIRLARLHYYLQVQLGKDTIPTKTEKQSLKKQRVLSVCISGQGMKCWAAL